MKSILKVKSGYYALTILMTMSFLVASVPVAKAQEVVILTPGDNKQINFLLSDVFNPLTLSPLQVFIIITIGDQETLSVSLSTEESSGDPLFRIEYTLAGFAYSPTEGTTYVFENASTPLSINTSIPINAAFGMVVLGAAVTSVRSPGEFKFPALFTLTLGDGDGGGGGDGDDGGGDDGDHDDGDHDE